MKTADSGIPEAAAQLREAAAASKCWRCGCLRNSLKSIEAALPQSSQPPDLRQAMEAARQRLTKVQYDCLGCEVCYPALALNALEIGADACPADDLKQRDGWPPLPGSYVALRYHTPVAVCTLTDEVLMRALADDADAAVAIVGTMQTENLGVERLITNVLANPNIRFLIVCGADSRQAIGHLPGQSLVALAQNGLDEHSRIVGARGKRPVVRNISREAVEHFRRTVEVVDLIGATEQSVVADALNDRAARNPGLAEPFSPERAVRTMAGHLPDRMRPDPAGYFVVYVDRGRGRLALEHYSNDGVLDLVIEGATAAELYTPAIEKGLLSRFDHAAYLGRELARAEHALHNGAPYVQDAAPERAQAAPTAAAVLHAKETRHEGDESVE